MKLRAKAHCSKLITHPRSARLFRDWGPVDGRGGAAEPTRPRVLCAHAMTGVTRRAFRSSIKRRMRRARLTVFRWTQVSDSG